MIASVIHQPLLLGSGLDAFSHNGESEAVGEDDDRLSERRVSLGVREASDEAAV